MESNKSKKAISRRKFLGNSAALAALSVVPVSAFGNGTGLLGEACLVVLIMLLNIVKKQASVQSN